MKARFEKLIRPVLPLGFSLLLLVLLLCGLSRATEAESQSSFQELAPEVGAIARLDYQAEISVCRQTENLAPNPSFEEGSGAQWKPDYWLEDGICEFSYGDQGFKDDISARIDSTSLVTMCKLRTRTDWISVEPGRIYDYSARVKANLVKGDAYLRIRFCRWQDDPPQWNCEGDGDPRHITHTHDVWLEVTGSVTVPVGTPYARIEATLESPSSGSVWFDDLFFGLATCLEISKCANPDYASRGELLTYTIDYSNTGRWMATDVYVIETYKEASEAYSYVDFRSAQPSPWNDTTNVWRFPELPPGARGTITVCVEVRRDVPEDLRWLFNHVTIHSNEITDPISFTLPIPFNGNGCKILLHLPLAEKLGEPGFPTGYDVSLQNAGACDGPVALEATSSRGWTVTIAPPPSYTLPSGEYKWVTVSPEVPLDEPGGSEDVTLVTATLTCDPPCTTTATTVAAITTTVVPISLTDVIINGPSDGHVAAPYAFTAVVSPVTANRPITYSWWASDQAKVVTATGFPSHAVVFTWSQTGTKTITVTASHELTTVTDTHTITIAASALVYMPLVFRCWPVNPPILYPIDNPDIDGEYTVCWNHVCSLDFQLNETNDGVCDDGKTIYYGPDDCYTVSDQVAGWYTYCVKACADSECSECSECIEWSDWSNAVGVKAWWEQEDNDKWHQANGPLDSYEGYYGYPDDTHDYFKFRLDGPGTITATLKGHTGVGVQLELYFLRCSASGDDCKLVPECRCPGPPYEIEHDVENPGWYYIHISTRKGHNKETPYVLQVGF